MCSVTTVLESLSPSICLPGPDSHLCESNAAVTRIKKSEYRPSHNTPRGKHSIDILISSWMQSVILFGMFFFLVIPFQIRFFFVLLRHAFIRTVDVFGPYLGIVLSLTVLRFCLALSCILSL